MERLLELALEPSGSPWPASRGASGACARWGLGGRRTSRSRSSCSRRSRAASSAGRAAAAGARAGDGARRLAHDAAPGRSTGSCSGGCWCGPAGAARTSPSPRCSRTCGRCARTPTSCAARAWSRRPSCWSPTRAPPPARRRAGARAGRGRARPIASCACAAPAGCRCCWRRRGSTRTRMPDLLEHDFARLAVGRHGVARAHRATRAVERLEPVLATEEQARGAGRRAGRAADARRAHDVRPARPAAGVRRRVLPRRPHELRRRGAPRRPRSAPLRRGCARPAGRTAARPRPRRRPSRRRCRPRAACPAGGRLGRQVGAGDRALDRVAVAAARDAARASSPPARRTGSEPSATARGSSSSRHASRVAGGPAARRSATAVAADEAAPACRGFTAKPSAGLVRRRLGREVAGPGAVALLQPQRVDGAVAAGASGRARRRRRRARPTGRARTPSAQYSSQPSSPTYVTRTARQRHVADRELARRQVREVGVGEARRASGAAGCRAPAGPRGRSRPGSTVTSVTCTEPSARQRGARSSARSWSPKAVPVTSRKRSAAEADHRQVALDAAARG